MINNLRRSESGVFLLFFSFLSFASLLSFFSKYVTKHTDDLRLKTLFDRILRLLSSSQPPETASGATLIQCIARIDRKSLSRLIPIDENEAADQLYLLIKQIKHRLNDELDQAKENLFQAAKHGPMYGCLSGINALLTLIQGEKCVVSQSHLHVFDSSSLVRPSI